MARRELGPAAQAVVRAVAAVLDVPGLVACSGGADSLALAWAAHRVADRAGLAVRAVIIDHQLQSGSGEVAATVRERVEGFGMAAEVVAVEVVADGTGTEAAARDARLGALEDAAAGEEVVLLGHTRDDQAENVLLGLARGSGVRSLAGMPARRGRFIRPLLELSRQTTRQCCTEVGLQWWQDPHNADPRFTRSRIRHRVLPVLEEAIGPGVAEALARTAGLARADADLLDDLAGKALAGQAAGSLSCGWLAGQPSGLRGRIVLQWLRQEGAGDLQAVHVAAVLELVEQWRGQRWVDLPGTRVSRHDGHLVVG